MHLSFPFRKPRLVLIISLHAQVERVYYTTDSYKSLQANPRQQKTHNTTTWVAG